MKEDATGPLVLRPGRAALSQAQVRHRRNRPVVHQFTYDVQQIWIDPDRPEELFDRHRLWSHRHPAPIRFRPRDYFLGDDEPIGPRVRAMTADVIGHEPAGPVRTLTQPRTWGWLFNPITVHLVWDGADAAVPCGALLEVTNTPWKERHHYALRLDEVDRALTAAFDKILHVSPFLDEDMTYHLTIDPRDPDGPHDTDGPAGGDDGFTIRIDAFADPVTGAGRDVGRDSRGDTTGDAGPEVVAQADGPVVETTLDVERPEPTPARLASAVRRTAPTHRVSAGIHAQAARLWRRGVPFVHHPDRHRPDRANDPPSGRPATPDPSSEQKP